MRHAFDDCTGWQEWVKEETNEKYLCVKCHRGRHNDRDCRQPTGVFWDVPYEPKKVLSAVVIRTNGQHLEDEQICPTLQVDGSFSGTTKQPPNENEDSYASLADENLDDFIFRGPFRTLRQLL